MLRFKSATSADTLDTNSLTLGNMNNGSKDSTDLNPMSPWMAASEIIGNAIRYWEPRRLLYNVILGLIVLGYFVVYLPDSKARLNDDSFLALCVLAVLANVCYCAAYLVDIFAQWSAVRSIWLRWRWVLFALGTGFAAIITRFFAMGFAGAGGID